MCIIASCAPRAEQRELIYVSRGVTLALGGGALALALATDPLDPTATVYKLVLYGWGGLAGCFSAPVVLALFYRGMTRQGCLAGMIAGSISVVLWRTFRGECGLRSDSCYAHLRGGGGFRLDVDRSTWSGHSVTRIPVTE